jgi:DNA-binding transcriptional LysR family regulator
MLPTPTTITARLKLRHMRFILALADTGSLARTAERLSVSYPAVVKTRLEIEEAIGARLLSGRGSACTFTEIGACLVETSRRIISELDCASEEVAALRDGLHGHVVVGVRSLDALRWLAPAIVAFRRRYPGVRVSLVDGLHREIARGDVDIGLARVGPDRHPEGLAFAPLFAIRSVVVGSGRYANAAKRAGPSAWRRLVAETWCLPPAGTPLRDRFEEFLHAQALPLPHDVIEISDMTAQVEILRAGDFLALASEEVARELTTRDIAQVVLKGLQPLDDHIALIWREDSRLHPVVSRFKQFLLDEAG